VLTEIKKENTLEKIEQFLIKWAGVIDVSVLQKNNKLVALLTVTNDFVASQKEIQYSCMENLGIHQTPHQILIVRINEDKLKAA